MRKEKGEAIKRRRVWELPLDSVDAKCTNYLSLRDSGIEPAHIDSSLSAYSNVQPSRRANQADTVLERLC